MRKLLLVAGLATALTGCGGGDDDTSRSQGTPSLSTTPSLMLCSTIELGATVDVQMLEDGCSDPDRNTIVVLNHTKCRGDGGDFGTFDLEDPQSGEKKDQLFAYRGRWHSTNAEASLYQKAFTQCL